MSAASRSFRKNQRHSAQVLAVQPEQVERVQDRLRFAAEKLVELADAIPIDANDLTVNDGVLDGQSRQRFLQRCEPEMLQVAGNEFALTAFDVHQRSKAVVLQFEDVIGIVERFLHEAEPHGVDAWKHTQILMLKTNQPEFFGPG